MKDWLPTMPVLPDLSAWESWPWEWIALGLLLLAGVLLVLKRITSKGTNMGWNWPWNKPATAAATAPAPAVVAVAAPAPSSDASEIAALRELVAAQVAQISELMKLLHQSAPVQMTPVAPVPSLPQTPPAAVAPVAAPVAAPALGGGTPWMPTATAALAKNIHSNTPDVRRWPDLTADGLPIFYMLAPGQGADAGRTVVVNPAQYAVYYDGEYMPPGEVAGRFARNIARDANLANPANTAAGPGKGSIHVALLSNDDKRYLDRMQGTNLYGGGDALWFNVLSGSRQEIAEAIVWAGYNSANYDIASNTNDVLKAAVAAAPKG